MVSGVFAAVLTWSPLWFLGVVLGATLGGVIGTLAWRVCGFLGLVQRLENDTTRAWYASVTASTNTSNAVESIDEMTQRVAELTQRVDELTRRLNELTQGVDRLAVRCGEGVALTRQARDDVGVGLAAVAQQVLEVRGLLEKSLGVWDGP